MLRIICESTGRNLFFFFLRRINATKIERSCDKIWAKSKSLITACTCKPSNFLLRLIIFVFQNIKFARVTIGPLDVETKMVLFIYDSPILLIQLITWRDSVHPRRKTISHRTRPRKIPRWIVLVRVNFSYKQTYLQQIKQLKLCEKSEFLGSFVFKFYIWLSRFSSWKVGNNSIWFLNYRAEEN